MYLSSTSCTTYNVPSTFHVCIFHVPHVQPFMYPSLMYVTFQACNFHVQPFMYICNHSSGMYLMYNLSCMYVTFHLYVATCWCNFWRHYTTHQRRRLMNFSRRKRGRFLNFFDASVLLLLLPLARWCQLLSFVSNFQFLKVCHSLWARDWQREKSCPYLTLVFAKIFFKPNSSPLSSHS